MRNRHVGVGDPRCGRQFPFASRELGPAVALGIMRQSSAIEAVAAQVKAAKVPVLLGNYWWIWDIQYLLNETARFYSPRHAGRHQDRELRPQRFQADAGHAGQSQSVPLCVCRARRIPPPGLEEDCELQIASFRFQNGFPSGNISELSRSEVGDFKLTLYELGRPTPTILPIARRRRSCCGPSRLVRPCPARTPTPSKKTALPICSVQKLREPIRFPGSRKTRAGRS